MMVPQSDDKAKELVAHHYCVENGLEYRESRLE